MSSSDALILIVATLLLAFLLEVFVKYVEFSGFSRKDAITIVVLPLLAWIYLPPVKFGNIYNMTLYLSFSGFIIPVTVALKQIVTGNVNIKKVIFGTFLVAIVSYTVSRPGFGGVGIAYPQLPILVASIYPILVERKKPAPLAYTCASLGMFIGADLLNIPKLCGKSIYVTVGGAGIFDAIYLTGIAALILDTNVCLIKYFVERYFNIKFNIKF
ncbi:MAG: hypothetical protein DSY33_04575 [Archaeoglobus sp.]|nr:MAG: hypothetical protein DSY33_04575 [Archaeoglobus sp.]